MPGRSDASLQDLEDDHLLIIFSKLDPLPDLFAIAQACKRFHRLASSGDLSLRVGYTHHNIPGKRQLAHKSLLEAVRNSRKGDTIVVSPGQQHRLETVITDHPLRIVGGGERPEDTLLICLSDLMPGLDFRATGEVRNLSMRAGKSPCVEQFRGRLKIDRCVLMSHPERGLEHLSSPVRFDPFRRYSRHSHKTSAQLLPAAACLSVSETVFRGQNGMRAVDTSTSRSLIKDVRVVELGVDTLYWFTVDSGGRQPYTQSHRVKEIFVKNAKDLEQGVPCWAQHGKELFPHQGSKRQLGEEASSPAKDTCESYDPAKEIDLKARHWKARKTFC